MSTAAQDNQARAAKCTTNQYDQIVAISADMLNEQLESLFRNVPDMQRISIENRYIGNLKANLKPPRISIPIAGQNFTKINYHLRIADADVTFFIDDETKQPLIKDWELVFTCDIAMDDIKNPDELKALRDGLCIAGDYSVQRLLIDFNTANVTRFDKSLSNMPYPDKLPKSAAKDWSDAWTTWIQKWLDNFPGTEKFIYGEGDYVTPKKKVTMLYHATAPDPAKVNPLVPTFPPKIVYHQTDYWKRDGQENSLNQGRNCLLYLEMCGDGAVPPPTQFYQHTGNFVSEDRSIDGAMCVSRKLFIERYFLEHLRQVVWGTQCGIGSVSVDASSEASSFTYNLFIADSSAKYWEEKFRLKTVDGKTGFHCSLPSTNQKSDYPGGVLWGGEIQVDVTNDVSLVWAEGSNRLTLSGSGKINLHTTGKTVGISSGKKIVMSFSWNVYFDFVTDTTNGKLAIDVKYPEPFLNITTEAMDTEGLMIGGYDMSEAVNWIKSSLGTQVEKCKPYLEAVKKSLSESKFVLSGSGYFKFSDPIFTKNGDLLVNIKYLSLESGKKLKDKGNQLGVVPDTKVSISVTAQTTTLKLKA